MSFLGTKRRGDLVEIPLSLVRLGRYKVDDKFIQNKNLSKEKNCLDLPNKILNVRFCALI